MRCPRVVENDFRGCPPRFADTAGRLWDALERAAVSRTPPCTTLRLSTDRLPGPTPFRVAWRAERRKTCCAEAIQHRVRSGTGARRRLLRENAGGGCVSCGAGPLHAALPPLPPLRRAWARRRGKRRAAHRRAHRLWRSPFQAPVLSPPRPLLYPHPYAPTAPPTALLPFALRRSARVTPTSNARAARRAGRVGGRTRGVGWRGGVG